MHYTKVSFRSGCLDTETAEIKECKYDSFVCVCETWSLTLRKERRLTVFENRIPRSIFGPIWAKEGRGNRRLEKIK